MKLGLITICEMFHHHEGFSNDQVALIGLAGVILGGILTGIIPQMFIRSKENKNKKRELIYEERRITFLINGYYKLRIFYLVDTNYWYRLHEIASKAENVKHMDVYFQKCLASNHNGLLIQDKLNVAFSEYFATITHFVTMTKESDIINRAIENIQTFDIGEVRTFETVMEKDLKNEREKIETELHLKYNVLHQYFNDISAEMSEMQKK